MPLLRQLRWRARLPWHASHARTTQTRETTRRCRSRNRRKNGSACRTHPRAPTGRGDSTSPRRQAKECARQLPRRPKRLLMGAARTRTHVPPRRQTQLRRCPRRRGRTTARESIARPPQPRCLAPRSPPRGTPRGTTRETAREARRLVRKRAQARPHTRAWRARRAAPGFHTMLNFTD